MILIDLNDFIGASYLCALEIFSVLGFILSLIFLVLSAEVLPHAGEEETKVYLRSAGFVWFITFCVLAAYVYFPSKKTYIYDTITKKYVTEENIEYMMKLHKSSREDGIKAIYTNIKDQLIEVGIVNK